MGVQHIYNMLGKHQQHDKAFNVYSALHIDVWSVRVSLGMLGYNLTVVKKALVDTCPNCVVCQSDCTGPQNAI